MNYAERMALAERHILEDALSRCGGNATETARLLKLPLRTLRDRLQRHGISSMSFRPQKPVDPPA